METLHLVYNEEQPYRELPPFMLLAAVGTLFGWFLIIWVGVMGRPLGALELPTWLVGAIGLPLGVLLPIAYARLRMTTAVYPDRIVVNNGMSGGVTLPLADVTAVLAPHAAQIFSETWVESVVLYESVMKSIGSEYSVRAEWPLEGPKKPRKRQSEPVENLADHDSEDPDGSAAE